MPPNVKKSAKTLAKKTFEDISKKHPPMSTTNPDFEEFRLLVAGIHAEIDEQISYRKQIKDDSPESIEHYTNEIIKKHLRASKWA